MKAFCDTLISVAIYRTEHTFKTSFERVLLTLNLTGGTEIPLCTFIRHMTHCQGHAYQFITRVALNGCFWIDIGARKIVDVAIRDRQYTAVSNKRKQKKIEISSSDWYLYYFYMSAQSVKAMKNAWPMKPWS